MIFNWEKCLRKRGNKHGPVLTVLFALQMIKKEEVTNVADIKVQWLTWAYCTLAVEKHSGSLQSTFRRWRDHCCSCLVPSGLLAVCSASWSASFHSVADNQSPKEGEGFHRWKAAVITNRRWPTVILWSSGIFVIGVRLCLSLLGLGGTWTSFHQWWKVTYVSHLLKCPFQCWSICVVYWRWTDVAAVDHELV